jgi:YVTN family beta-propeller protein
MKTIMSLLPALICIILFVSCEEDKNDLASTGYLYGVYIVNEGAFMSNNGSVSYFDPEENTITNSVFEFINGRPLGDVVQSFTVINDTIGYIVVNGSAKVEIIGLKTFKVLKEPVPVSYPRYFIQVDSHKGYLSSGSMQGCLQIFDLDTHTIEDSIIVGFGPENMVKLGNRVYVANSGGWGLDSTISVVDITNDQVVSSIITAETPLELMLDDDDMLWVYCKGYANYSWEPPYDLISETDAKIQKIDPVSGNIVWQGVVGKAGDYTATLPKMAISAGNAMLYYLRPDGVYRIDVNNPEIPINSLINGSFYGIEVNPSDENIYLFESSFTGNGMMKIYDEQGNQISQGMVGIAPNGAAFH